MTSGGKNNNYDNREKRTVKKMVHFCYTSVFNLNNTKTNSPIFLLNVYILNTGRAKSMGPFTKL